METSKEHESYFPQYDEKRSSQDVISQDSEEHSPSSSVIEYGDFGIPSNALTPTVTRQTQLSRNITRATTHGTTFTTDPSFEVDFEVGDPNDPRNWSMAYKTMVLFFLSISTLVVVLYSTSYTSAIGTMMEDFHLDSVAIPTLGLTTYLIGLAVGSVLMAPLSETYGRRPAYIISMFLFTILIIPAALAQNITTLIVVRFFSALFGSALIANAPGTIGDMVSDEYRALAFSLWSIGPMNGPVVGPIFGGWVTMYLSWRWANWIVMIISALSFVMLCIAKETYKPILLQKRAKQLRKSTGDSRHWSRYDVKTSFWTMLRVNLSRPFVMAVTEPICIFWNVYIGIIYGILYLCFASYPIVFRETRGWSLGDSSLAFCGIGVGIMITICLASPIKKMINAHKPDPKTGHPPPESMMSVVCIAAILVPVGELWFAWTCLPVSIHPALSIAAGIPFGAGNAAIFIYASNYLVGSYGIYAASALAGNSVIRSVLGGVMPLAGAPLYKALGANWAGTFLGLLEVLIIPVPFVFYKYGHRIREKSALIREMREIEERQEAKKRKFEEREARRRRGETEEEAAAVEVEVVREKGKMKSRSEESVDARGGVDVEKQEHVK